MRPSGPRQALSPAKACPRRASAPASGERHGLREQPVDRPTRPRTRCPRRALAFVSARAMLEPGQARRAAADREARGRERGHASSQPGLSSPSPPTSGCLSKRQQRHRRKLFGRGCGNAEQKRARRRPRTSGFPALSSASISHRGAAPRRARQAAGRASPAPPSCRASPAPRASASAIACASAAGSGSSASANAAEAPLGRAQRLPFVRKIGRRHGVGDRARAGRRRRRASRPAPALHLLARDADPVEQKLQMILRMALLRRGRCRPGRARPIPPSGMTRRARAREGRPCLPACAQRGRPAPRRPARQW